MAEVKTIEITAKATLKDDEGNVTGKEQATGTFTCGATILDDVELFGEAVVKSQLDARMTVLGQNFMRQKLEGGATPDEAKAALAEWVMGEVKPVVRKPKGQKALDNALSAIDDVTPEQAALFIRQLQEKMANPDGVSSDELEDEEDKEEYETEEESE